MHAFGQELSYFLLHARDGAVLWIDGDHGFNPYDFAETNLVRGWEADWGAERMLVKRCMTPFQWDTVLTKHLDPKLLETETAAVLVVPYDRLFSTDELKDWEQEDYVAYSLKHLRQLARRHKVPILLAVDMAAWWRSHPVLAKATFEGVDERWSVHRLAGRWRAVKDGDEAVLDPELSRQVTLWSFDEEATEKVLVTASPVHGTYK